MNWSHTRSWTGLNNGSLNGNGWAVTSVPYIVVAGGDNGIGIVLAGTENDDRLSIVWGGIQSKAFTIPTTGPYTSFQPWGAQLTKLEQVTGVLRFTDDEGNVTEF